MGVSAKRDPILRNFEMKPEPAYDVAPTVSVIEDEIVLVGPGAIAFSMTREAARETHRRLGVALGQSPADTKE